MNIPYAMRKCSKCGKWLVANNYNFNKNKKCKWGLNSKCKECSKKYYKENKDRCDKANKKWRKENKDKIAKSKNKYYKNNKDKISKYKKKYYEDNKYERLEYSKKYYEDNRYERLEYANSYRKENKEVISERKKKWWKNNPDKAFNHNNKRRQKENIQGNGINKEQWFEMMEFFQWTCAYSGEYIGGDSEFRTIDHIIPLDNNGEHEIWNCIPMYANYNYSKHNTNMLEWYLEQPFFSIDRLTKIYEWRIYAYWKWSDVI